MLNDFQARRLAAPAAIAFSLALTLAGCGDDDGGMPTRYAVSGKVTHKGEPVKKGSINFIPSAEDGHAASGNIQDGTYQLTTLKPEDGAIPGTYKVTVSDRQLDSGALQAESDALAKKKKVTYTRIPPELQAKAVAKHKATGTIPARYEAPTTSGLEKEVKSGSNTIDIELTE
ncbi:hypothetical protein EP7_002575 [Isosphaeraceae bacterium EP7]